MVDLQFALEGDAPVELRKNMAEFARAAQRHPWGGTGPALVVVSRDLCSDYHRLMPARRFQEWSLRQDARRESTEALGVGMAFEARNGEWTAVVADLGDESLVLTLFGHEYLEAALSRRLLAGGNGEPATAEDTHARAIWGEYVVERARREIGEDLGWRLTALDQSHLGATAADALAAAPSQHPHWYSLLVLDFAKCAARADANVQDEADELRRFFSSAFQTEDWRGLYAELQAIYAAPRGNASSFDGRIWDAWATIWTNR